MASKFDLSSSHQIASDGKGFVERSKTRGSIGWEETSEGEKGISERKCVFFSSRDFSKNEIVILHRMKIVFFFKSSNFESIKSKFRASLSCSNLFDVNSLILFAFLTFFSQFGCPWKN